ncbi:MAG: NAD(P)-binding domain-containing protein, partial [Herbiconiux sp.]|nr:NAD(P)-binding domain-containing protein [Herbiconiux sp.]
GGAWQHRWASLTLATVNGIFDLPGMAKPPFGDEEPSREAIPRYFAEYEREQRLPILRPVEVTAVRRLDAHPDGPLAVETDAGTWRARFVVNATGTWTNPVRPTYPGQETFLGRQLHTGEYRSLEEFRGHRVAVVGGGISAVQQLEEISRVAFTAWYTRREPVFLDGPFAQETGRDTIARVTADARLGRPAGSVVSYTGLFWTLYALAARDRGALVRRPMFTAIEPHGVREADGSFTTVDTILWATGFRAALGHLAPLGLRGELGGIVLDGTRVAAEPRVHLVGIGPSQSTVGANRAGREAATAIVKALAGPA